jgi:tyrosine-specific transport protein
MNYNRRKIHKAIICGTTLTLAIYLIWQFLFLGIVPVGGTNGLTETLRNGQDAIHSLQFFTSNNSVWVLGKAFAFFAIATSFLGVGIGVVDFLADGLGIKKRGLFNYVLLTAAAFAIPLFFAITYPYLFLHALGLAGGIGSAFLLGILPIVMAWRAKYVFNGNLCHTNLLSSRFFMLLLLAFVGYELVTQFILLLG